MTEQEIRNLLAQKSETANLDYKEGFVWTKDNRDKKYELVRDLMALANTKDGGKILFGVRNADFEFVGVAEDIYKSIDPNNVVQMLHDKASPKINCSISKQEIDGKKLVVFDVAEFEDVPVICTDTVKSEDNARMILRKGALYFRTTAAATEEISSAEEMRNLVSRAMTRRGDELLRTIQRLISGRPLAPEISAAELYEKEIREAETFLVDSLGKEALASGHVAVIAYPTDYSQKRIGSIPETRKLIEKAEVALTGWNFPHTDRESSASFARGVQSITIWEDIREGYRFYQSGLFIWKHVYSEDIKEYRSKKNNRVLSFLRLIYSYTEFLLFFKRLYEEITPDGSIHIKLALCGCTDRQLAAPEGLLFLGDWFVSREDTIVIEQDIRVVELRASWQEIARRMVQHVLHVFNWLDVQDDVIANWQDKLLKRS